MFRKSLVGNRGLVFYFAFETDTQLLCEFAKLEKALRPGLYKWRREAGKTCRP